MQSVTLIGEVQGGRILTGNPLTAFEGKQVYVTLIVADEPPCAVALDAKPTGSPVLPRALEEAENIEDAGRIRVPTREVTTVQINVLDVGRRPMCVYSSDMED